MAVIILAVGIYISFEKPYDSSDTYYYYYTSQLEGAVTDDTYAFIESENQRYAKLQEQLDSVLLQGGNSKTIESLQKQLEPKATLDIVVQHVERSVKELGNHAAVFYDTGYKRLFGISDLQEHMLYVLSVSYTHLTLPTMAVV